MLNVLRQNSRSTIITILFGILIAGFIVNLTPGRGCLGKNDQSESPDFREYAVKVGDLEISKFELFAETQFISRQYQKNPGQIKRFLLDHMIKTALFAREAKQMGLLVSKQEAIDSAAPRAQIMDGIVKMAKMAPADLVENEKKTVLARKLINLLSASVVVSPSEVRKLFDVEQRQVNVQYVRFSWEDIRKTLLPNEEEIAEFAKSHEEELKKQYESSKAHYQKQDPQVHVYRILLSVKKDAKPEEIEAAKTKAEGVLAQLRNHQPFAVVAKVISDDITTKERGGNWGFHKRGTLNLSKEQEDKLFAAKEGDLLGPEKTNSGFEIWKVGASRQGDISFENARLELAENLFYEKKPKELAKQAAEAAVKQVKAGTSLVKLFPSAKEETTPKDQISKLPSLSTEKLQTEETGFISEKTSLTQQGILSSKELGKQAFAQKVGDVLGPIERGNDYLVAVIKERKEPDSKEFEKTKETYTQTLRKEKIDYLEKEWAKKLCQESKKAGQIKINPEIVPSLAYEVIPNNNQLPEGFELPPELQDKFKQPNSKPMPAPPYEPCFSME